MFQYSLDCPHLNTTKVEKNRVIRTDIINLENKITWINRKISPRLYIKCTSCVSWCVCNLMSQKVQLSTYLPLQILSHNYKTLDYLSLTIS